MPVDILLTVPLIVIAGLAIGLLVSVPIGPVNVLCIQRTLSEGPWHGFVSGLGATFADSLIAALASFGFTAVDTELAAHRLAMQLIGGVVLLAFGLHLLLARPSTSTSTGQPRPARSDVAAAAQTFLLTVTNPGAVLGVFALVGAFGSLGPGFDTFLESGLLVLAVIAGSVAWWAFLARLISSLRHKLDMARARLINQLAGVVLLGFGTGLLARYALSLFG